MRAPDTKRTARAPDGRRWRVGRRWTSTSRPRLRRRGRNDARDADPSGLGQPSGDGQSGAPDGEGGGSLADLGAGAGGGGFDLGDLLDGEGLAIGLVLVVVLGLLFLLLFPLLEAAIAVVLLVGAVASRVVLRRPWRVEAWLLDGDRPRARAHWDVVGFRRSGRVARAVTEHIAATGELPQLTTDALAERSA